MQLESTDNDTMQFEYDPERLIEEVKKRPGIWDFEDPDYRAKNVRHQLWNEIVKELMQNDVKVSKSEMRELELQLQKKWKSIRDCFIKYISKPNRTKRPYIYVKHLQFLLKNQEVAQNDQKWVRSTNDSSESDDGQYNKQKKWKSKRLLKLSNTEQSSEEDNDNDNYENQEESREFSNDALEVSVPIKMPRLSKPDEFAFASVDTQIKNDADDPDRLFLLSLLPHMKSIPEEYRLNVKMELLQVLRNANYSTITDHKLI